MATPRSSGGRRAQVNMESVLIKQTMRVEELEAENSDLRDEIKALQRRVVPGSGNDQSRSQTEANTSNKEPFVSVSDYEALSAKYDELVRRNRVLDNEHSRMRLKYKEAKECVGKWKAYIDEKQRQREAKMAEQSADLQANVKPLPSGGQETNPNAASAPAVDQFEDNRELDSAAQTLPLDARKDYAERANPHTMRVTSSQTTDPGSYAPDMLSDTRQPSSDHEPVVVSSRSLKRKRVGSAVAMPPTVRIKAENSPERPLVIKSEQYSRPVLHRPNLLHHETSELDLDAEVEPMKTPKRRRGARSGTGQRAVSEELRRPPPLPAGVSSLSEGGLVELHEQGENIAASIPTPRSLELSSGRTSAHASEHALRPLSVNVPFGRRESAAKPTRRRRRRSDEEAAAKAALVSEDGESQRVGARPDAADKAAPKPIDSRLRNLLNGALPSFEPIDRNCTPRQGAVRRKRPMTPLSEQTPKPKPPTLKASRSPEKRIPAQDHTTEKRASPAKVKTPVTLAIPSVPKVNTSRYARPAGLEKSPPPVRPEDEPLRLRDVSTLRLEDFKINPKYAGSEFAYAEAARSKEERRCLQGCTNPDCCGGAFLKAVEMGATTGQPDSVVLEDYLGPDWEDMMGAYPKHKRDGLLKQAKAAALANKHGKHRHAFQRHSTPPGYWRVDMPTTQETAEDRAKASQMVRNKVEERWREAHRPGGRWKFRDE